MNLVKGYQTCLTEDWLGNEISRFVHQTTGKQQIQIQSQNKDISLTSVKTHEIFTPFEITDVKF